MDFSSELPDILLDIHKIFVCSICLDVAKEPVFTQCNHKFCNACILSVLKSKTKSQCPLCMVRIYKRGLKRHETFSKLALGVKKLFNAVKEDSKGLYSPPSSQYKISDKNSKDSDKRSSVESAVSASRKIHDSVPFTPQPSTSKQRRNSKGKSQAEKPAPPTKPLQKNKHEVTNWTSDIQLPVSDDSTVTHVDFDIPSSWKQDTNNKQQDSAESHQDFSIPSSWLASNNKSNNHSNSKTYMRPKLKKIETHSPLTPSTKVQAWLNQPEASTAELNLPDNQLTQKVLSPADESIQNDSIFDLVLNPSQQIDSIDGQKDADTSFNIFLSPAVQDAGIVEDQPSPKRRVSRKCRPSVVSSRSEIDSLSSKINDAESFDLIVNDAVPINDPCPADPIDKPVKKAKKSQPRLKDVTNFFVSKSAWRTTKEMARKLSSNTKEIIPVDVPIETFSVQMEDDPYTFISSQKTYPTKNKRKNRNKKINEAVRHKNELNSGKCASRSSPIKIAKIDGITPLNDPDSDRTEELEITEDIVFAPTPGRKLPGQNACDEDLAAVVSDSEDTANGAHISLLGGKAPCLDADQKISEQTVSDDDMDTVVPDSEIAANSDHIPFVGRKTFCLEAETQDLLALGANCVNTLDEFSALSHDAGCDTTPIKEAETVQSKSDCVPTLDTVAPQSTPDNASDGLAPPVPMADIPNVDPDPLAVESEAAQPRGSVQSPLPSISIPDQRLVQPNARTAFPAVSCVSTNAPLFVKIPTMIQTNIKRRVMFMLKGALQDIAKIPDSNTVNVESVCLRCIQATRECCDKAIQVFLDEVSPSPKETSLSPKNDSVNSSQKTSSVDRAIQVVPDDLVDRNCTPSSPSPMSSTFVPETEMDVIQSNNEAEEPKDDVEVAPRVLKQVLSSETSAYETADDQAKNIDCQSPVKLDVPSVHLDSSIELPARNRNMRKIRLKDSDVSESSSSDDSDNELDIAKSVKSSCTSDVAPVITDRDDIVIDIDNELDKAKSVKSSYTSNVAPIITNRDDIVSDSEPEDEEPEEPVVVRSSERNRNKPSAYESIKEKMKERARNCSSSSSDSSLMNEPFYLEALLESTSPVHENTPENSVHSDSQEKSLDRRKVMKRIRQIESSDSEEENVADTDAKRLKAANEASCGNNPECIVSSQNSEMLTENTMKTNELTACSALSGISQLDTSEKRQQVEENLRLEIEALKRQMKSMHEEMQKKKEDEDSAKGHDESSQDLFMSPPEPSQPVKEANKSCMSSYEFDQLFEDDFM